MEKLFFYSATAYLAADDSDYSRLEIKVNPDKENFPKGIYCEQLCVWLPVGDSGESIADIAPIPFVDSARWLTGQGSLIPAAEMKIKNDRDQTIQIDEAQMLQTYFFDDIKSGETIIEPDNFTIGFLIERIRSRVKKGFTFYLQEKSKANEADDFNHFLVPLQASIQHCKPTISYFISLKDGNPCATFKQGEPIHLRWEGSSVKEYELYADDKRLEIDDKTINEYMIHSENSPKRDTTFILKGTGHLKDRTYQTLTVIIINPALFINENGNVGIGTTSPEKRLDVKGDVQIAGAGPVDYKIELVGSARESKEGDFHKFFVNEKSLTGGDVAGLRTAVLSPDGNRKHMRDFMVWDSKGAEDEWNHWAKWINKKAEDGDAVAVMSGRGLHNAPRGGAAEQLLNSIGAKKAFKAVRGAPCSPYALLFIKGSSVSIEVSQPYRGPNAHIISTYRELTELPGADGKGVAH